MIRLEKDYYKETNKKCFILGTGPSINNVPFEKLSDHVTIGVNLIMFAGYVPDYLCVSDRDMIVDNYEHIINEKMNDGIYVIARPKNKEVATRLENKENVYLIEPFKENVFPRKPFIDPKFKKFAVTKDGVINDLAVSLAAYLGFDEIHLLGVDGEHGSEAHFYDHSGVVNKKDSIIRGPRESTKYNFLIEILNKKNIRIFNCSDNGGKTPEIKSKTLKEVLGE